jgi:hypothetical protein
MVYEVVLSDAFGRKDQREVRANDMVVRLIIFDPQRLYPIMIALLNLGVSNYQQ